MKKYTIETNYYNDRNIETYDSYEEWMRELSIASNESDTRGRGDNLTACIYEADNKDSYVEYNKIPENWELLESHNVSYWSLKEIWAEKTGEKLTYLADIEDDKPEPEPEPENDGIVISAYSSDCEIYETEAEAIEFEDSSLYIN